MLNSKNTQLTLIKKQYHTHYRGRPFRTPDLFSKRCVKVGVTSVAFHHVETILSCNEKCRFHGNLRYHAGVGNWGCFPVLTFHFYDNRIWSTIYPLLKGKFIVNPTCYSLLAGTKFYAGLCAGLTLEFDLGASLIRISRFYQICW